MTSLPAKNSPQATHRHALVVKGSAFPKHFICIIVSIPHFEPLKLRTAGVLYISRCPKAVWTILANVNWNSLYFMTLTRINAWGFQILIRHQFTIETTQRILQSFVSSKNSSNIDCDAAGYCQLASPSSKQKLCTSFTPSKLGQQNHWQAG